MDAYSFTEWAASTGNMFGEIQFEHIHYDGPTNQLFGGKKENCPLGTCVYERHRMEQLQEHYMKDYNGG